MLEWGALKRNVEKKNSKAQKWSETLFKLMTYINKDAIGSQLCWNL